MTKTFFEQNPPSELDLRILRAAEVNLAENRRALRRRQFLQWLIAPAFATAAGAFLILRFSRDQVPDGASLQAAEFIEWKDLDPEDQELVADLDLIEDLDVLEGMEDT